MRRNATSSPALSARLLLLTGLAGLLAGCSGGASSSGPGFALTGTGASPQVNTAPTSTANPWTWVSGSFTLTALLGLPPVYGTPSVASAANTPGGRYGASSWTDANGNLWLFGGTGPASLDTYVVYGDMWEYSTASNQWTFQSGSSAQNSTGTYTTPGSAATTNAPASRYGALTWTDTSGNLWLYGGVSIQPIVSTATVTLNTYSNGVITATSTSTNTTTTTTLVYLDDFWEFTPSTGNWTWVAGSNPNTGAYASNAVYGTKGTPAAANYPGVRQFATSWVDSNGNFWLFGGAGFSTGSETTKNPSTTPTNGVQSVSVAPGASGSGSLSDLWEYNVTTGYWTWQGGSSSYSNVGNATDVTNTDAESVYGTQGTPSTSNFPGARYGALGWPDKTGDLWLYGGYGNVPNPAATATTPTVPSQENDLWEYNIANKTWTWVSGSVTAQNPSPVYGAQGTAAAANTPGGRLQSVTWTDTSGNFWLLGGTDTTATFLNDMWEYSPTSGNWTWFNGASVPNPIGVYGKAGAAAASNDLGGRVQATSWVDGKGNFWIFGGTGIDSIGATGALNDMWTVVP